MANTVVRKVDNGSDILMKCMAHLSKGIQGIRVGYVGENATKTHPDSDLTMAELGLIHEYGLGVPERPHIRPASVLAQKDLMKAYQVGNKKMMRMIKAGNKDVQVIVKAGLQDASEYLEEVFKNYIRDGKVSPPTEDGGTPLNDTGAMLGAISSRIEDKNGK